VNARIGLNIPINIAYILGVIFALVYIVLIYRQGNKLRDNNAVLENPPVYK
jgi:hypothetical protein